MENKPVSPGENPPDSFVRAHYTKYEFRIPMRDGIRLFTAVYVPKSAPQPLPILMQRTPYGVRPYGVDNYPGSIGPSREFEASGYIFVFQDVRGRFMSEGVFSEMRPHLAKKRGSEGVDESTDAYDTIEFLLKRFPNSNGSVGLTGVSYMGFYVVAGMIDAHPALKAASPQAPMGDLFMGDDAYHNGAFQLAYNCDFFKGFRRFEKPQSGNAESPAFKIGPDGYDFFLKVGSTENLDKAYFKGANPYFCDRLFHTTYDEFWKTRDICAHLNDISCAVLTVGGWFDAENLAGPLKIYGRLREGGARSANKFVIGPWSHAGWESKGRGDRLGDIRFNAKTTDFFHEKILFPFFEKYLKGREASLPEVFAFETGCNVWRSHRVWPPEAAGLKTMYFRAGGKLGFEPPAESEGADEYVSDPARPVPFTSQVTGKLPAHYMLDDQRFAARRPDVLVYQTEPLEEDLTVAGPIEAELFVSTTGTDADFVVKLIDVYPEGYAANKTMVEGKPVFRAPDFDMSGYQQLVRGEPIRAKFRRSWEKPVPMTPGEVERLSFAMPDVYHTFRRGHSIMVHVQSSWFPLFDRNPQTFVDIPRAKPGDFRKATHRVYRKAGASSALRLRVLPPSY